MARTIPAHIWKLPSERLVTLVTPSPIYTQLLAKCDHKEDPLRTPHGIHSPSPSTHTHLHGPINNQPVPTSKRIPSTSEGCHQTGPGTNDEAPLEVHTLQRGRQSLARSSTP